jgi:hypothetical protein
MAAPVKVIKSVHEIADKFENIIEKELFFKLTSRIDEVKGVIVDSYSQQLTNVVTDKRSKTRPEDYIEDFITRLDNFEYVTVTNGQVSFTVPDMANFDFSGKLRVIENILEGIVGQYVEVNGDQYAKIFGKSGVTKHLSDSSLSTKEKIYLLKYNAFIRSKEKELKTNFVMYPFSNAGPMDIFKDVNDYVATQLPLWLKEAVVDAQLKLGEVIK